MRRLPPLLPALLLGACATVPGPTPEGRVWALVELRGQALAPTPLPRLPQLEMREGRVSGSSGCNRFTGSYTLQGEGLRFGPAAGTRRACVDGMALETEFLQLLPQVASWRFQGSLLAWHDAQGQRLARFDTTLQRYQCDDGSTLLLRHGPGGAQLALGDRDFAMRSAPGASGARYVTEQGRRPDWSMEWHAKGGEGLLLEAPLSDARKPEDLKPFAHCKAA
jgi:heat shock protein HslJ